MGKSKTKTIEAKDVDGRIYLTHEDGSVDLVIAVASITQAVEDLGLTSEDAPEKPSKKETPAPKGKGKKAPEPEPEEEEEEELTPEDIEGMSKKELLALIEEEDLDVDPDGLKLGELREAVSEELFGEDSDEEEVEEVEEDEEDEEEEDDEEAEEEEEEDDDVEEWDDDDEEEEEEPKKPTKKKKK